MCTARGRGCVQQRGKGCVQQGGKGCVGGVYSKGVGGVVYSKGVGYVYSKGVGCVYPQSQYELRPADACMYGYSKSSIEVCINPCHYRRVETQSKAWMYVAYGHLI